MSVGIESRRGIDRSSKERWESQPEMNARQVALATTVLAVVCGSAVISWDARHRVNRVQSMLAKNAESTQRRLGSIQQALDRLTATLDPTTNTALREARSEAPPVGEDRSLQLSAVLDAIQHSRDEIIQILVASDPEKYDSSLTTPSIAGRWTRLFCYKAAPCSLCFPGMPREFELGEGTTASLLGHEGNYVFAGTALTIRTSIHDLSVTATRISRGFLHIEETGFQHIYVLSKLRNADPDA